MIVVKDSVVDVWTGIWVTFEREFDQSLNLISVYILSQMISPKLADVQFVGCFQNTET